MSTRAPLDGFLVVSVEQAVAAPVCTARLADAGARVIKVERPGGDFARGYDSAAGGDSSYFAWANHGKESVVLDLDEPEDSALLHRVIERADVFVQNLAPGSLERRGFGAADLRRRLPRLVTCDISGYGESPELARKRAYDLLVQAESGIIGISGGPNELGRIGVSICDIGTGITAHAAILEALLGRSTTGEGMAIRISLFDVAAEWMTVPLVQHAAGLAVDRVGLRHPTIAPYGAYETRDGALTLISIQNEREWVRLCRDVLGRGDVATDPRFDSNERRVEHRDELDRALSDVIGTIDRNEFRRRLDAAAIAWGGVNDLDDVLAHAAFRSRSIVSSAGGLVELPAHPVRDGRDREPGLVPTVGADTERVRAEFAG